MDDPLFALLVEDSADDAELIGRHLRQALGPVTLERVRNLVELRAALQTRPWDVVLADHTLPTLRPPDTVQELQARGLDVPVIIVSGRLNPYAAVAALQAGARDYVSKDDLRPLPGIVQREVARARERHRAQGGAAREREFWRAVLDATAVGVIAIDGDGRVTTLNVAAARCLGLDRAAVEGRPSVEVLPAALLELTPGTSREVAIGRAGDAMRHVTACVRPVLGPDGPVFVVSIAS